MLRNYLICLCVLHLLGRVLPQAPPPTTTPAAPADEEEPPEGYYAFVESPNATPPRVRPPPYRQVSSACPEATSSRAHVSAHNLCGDLNRGVIPANPMGHSLNGEPYPFELIRNLTLRFLSRTLPVLRADDTLPRVTHKTQAEIDAHSTNSLEEIRRKRSLADELDKVPSAELPAEHRSEARESKKFCDNGGVFCMLYRAINGEPAAGAAVERREDPGTGHAPPAAPAPPRYEGPPTPCPARVEYATPVFARNYQGVWRYVVQIPYEGYFTQTVEVTRCMQSRCHYLDGGCLSSPRWVSLLVAELHYPPAASPAGAQQQGTTLPPQIQGDFQEYQQYLQKRAGQPQPQPQPGVEPGADKPPHCDGHDDMGCYQVRLYYDWFLVPGSCKCWRPDYFARYVRRRHSAAAAGEL